MAKNLHTRAPSASYKKASYSHESSPLHTYKSKKDSPNCFQPSEPDTHLKLSSKPLAKKVESRPLTANVFINNLNVQINSSSQGNQRKVPVPLSASITNRKTSKQYSVLTQKEEAALAAFREGKSKQKAKTTHSGLEEGISYEMRKNPMALVSRNSSEVPVSSSYIPKFKGSDPNNKFMLRSPPKAFPQQETRGSNGATAGKVKKPNSRGTQKSFDVNAGGFPVGKYTSYLNNYLKPAVTANNSPKNKDSEEVINKFEENETAGRGVPSNTGPKQTKSALEKGTVVSKTPVKSGMAMSKHKKTPSFDHTKRSESIAQKTLTPPILDRMRKSADCGDYRQTGQELYNNKTPFQFAIRTRAGVAPNGTRKINQDSFVFHTNYGQKSDRYLLGVCDGHGMNGHLVSGFVKEALPVYLLADPNFDTHLSQAMTNAFELCNQKLLVGDVDCRFSGTTTAIVMIDGNRIITANAGDSRAILGSYSSNTTNKGWNYTPITFDHKPDTPQEAHRIIKSGGRIEPFKDGEGNYVGPSRVWLANQDIPGLAMSRSIGDFVAQSVGVSCVPEIKEFSINQSDRFMIVASDGIWEFIESIDVVKIIAPFYEQDNIEGACDFLMGVALRRWQEEEEVVVDDITLIVVFF